MKSARNSWNLVSSALKVIRTVRVKKACVRCDCIVEATAPSRPIGREIAGPGLLARVLTGKYSERTPLYRQTEILARQGVDLSRALLSNWVDAWCRYWHRAERRRKPGVSGRMCAMTGALDRLTRQRRGSPSLRINRGSILSNIFAIIMEYRLRRVRQVVQRRA